MNLKHTYKCASIQYECVKIEIRIHFKATTEKNTAQILPIVVSSNFQHIFAHHDFIEYSIN